MSMYIWLLLKLFLGHVYEQEKCVYKGFWLSFNAFFKKIIIKNPNVSIMRS